MNWILASLTCLVEAQGAVHPADPFYEVVIRDLIEPESSGPNIAHSYNAASALGDLNRDGMRDVDLEADYFDLASGVTKFEHFMLSGGTSRRAERYKGERWNHVQPRSHKFLPTVALLRAPTGLRLVSRTVLPNEELGIWDERTMAFVGYVPFPPSPIPGLDPIRYYYGVWSAGDTDADGYDDLFFVTEQSQGHAVTGLVDGRLLQVRWLQYEAPLLEDYYPILDSTLESRTDLNGDSIADMITGFGLYPPNSSSVLVVARSGVNGQLLWKQQLAGWYGYSAGGCGLDLTDDGVSEVFAATSGSSLRPGYFYMLDGSSGATRWSRSSLVLDGLLPLDVDQYSFPGPVWLESSPAAASSKELCLFTSYFTHWPIRHGALVSYLDAATGRTITSSEFPDTLFPWRATAAGVYQACYLLGDVDRDGYNEYGAPVRLPPTLLSGMAMYGRRTLVLPPGIRGGETVTLSLSIPSAPRQSYFLLCTDEFTPSAGEFVDGWRTHFAATQLLDYSLRNRPGAGVLDAQGRASQSFTLPALPVPPGTELFVRTVILEPGSRDEVWTLSSVETTRYE